MLFHVFLIASYAIYFILFIFYIYVSMFQKVWTSDLVALRHRDRTSHFHSFASSARCNKIQILFVLIKYLMITKTRDCISFVDIHKK